MAKNYAALARSVIAALAASKDPVIADNNDLTTLTATVADTEGNAIANAEVTFTQPEDVRANFTLSDGGKAITESMAWRQGLAQHWHWDATSLLLPVQQNSSWRLVS